LADGANPVRARIAAFRQLGAAYKAVTDGVRASELEKVRQASRRIVAASHAMYGWFPRGSGPQRGVKTAARPDIWMRPAEFRAKQDAFARESAAFERVARSSDAGAIRTVARRLGATCKGCHDDFRVPND
jgi:cytochrome c556